MRIVDVQLVPMNRQLLMSFTGSRVRGAVINGILNPLDFISTIWQTI
jgi:hypothetical protein